MAQTPGENFSLVIGGPFHGLLQRFGLTGPERLPTLRAAVCLALLAWLPLALLAVAQSLLDPSYSGWGFFTDWTAYARFLVAISVMIATEAHADGRLQLLAREFPEASLLTDAAAPAYRAALLRADRRSSSAFAEALILLCAIAASTITTHFVIELDRAGWEAVSRAGDVGYSWAGLAARFWSVNLFLFLVLRWGWRFIVWAELLYRISRSGLRLMPAHPDRAGGIGFLAIYPGTFSGFLFALSCVVSSSILRDLALEVRPSEVVWTMLGGWVALSALLFIGPLFVFTRPLYEARERALLDYGRLATQHHLAFQTKWIDQARNGADLLAAADASSASDLNAVVSVVEEMRLVPVDRAAVLQLIAVAAIPLLPVVFRLVPLGDILKYAIGTLL